MSRWPQPPQGYVPMNRATVCLDCRAIYFLGPCCPACASEAMMPLAKWMERERHPVTGQA